MVPPCGLPGSGCPDRPFVDGWCGWCCFVAFADVAEAADDHNVVDMVLPSLAVRDDVVHLGGRWCLPDVVVEFNLACWTVR